MAGKWFVFRFFDVEVREREFTLVKAGEVLPVEPKAFRVMLFLLRNPHRLISKEELLNAVWGDVAVSENSLTRAIALLRRLLGDDIHAPRFIETVATVGYRWICAVEAAPDGLEGLDAPNSMSALTRVEGASARGDGIGAEDATIAEADKGASIGSQEAQFHKPNTRLQRLWRRWIAVAGVLAAGTAFLVWYFGRPLPVPRVVKYTRITHDGGRKELIGTDGSRVYFNQRNSPQPIVQIAISGGEAVPVPVALPAPGPWLKGVSPDGTRLLAYSTDGGQGHLWSVGSLDGSTRHLADGSVVSAAWSPDGKSLVYCTLSGEIDVVQSDGTGQRRLAAGEDHRGSGYTHYLSWSPDGKTIRFDRDYRLYEMSSYGTGLHPLLPAWHPSSLQFGGNWTPDGRFYEFVVWDAPMFNYSTQGPLQIWALDERRGMFRRPRNEPVAVTSGPIDWGRPFPSKDGKKILVQGAILRGELVRYDEKSHQLQPYLAGTSVEDVSFSRDGRFMVYVTFPDGILWRANRDGSNAVELTDRPWYPTMPRWSPDGSQILFFGSNLDGIFKSYTMSSQGGSPHPIFPEDKTEQTDPNWSPDGNRVVFASGIFPWTGGGDPKGELRILDLSSRKVTTVPGSVGTYSPRWSPDGRFIAGLDSLSRILRVFDCETRRWSELPTGAAESPTWSRSGQYLYFLRTQGDPGVYRIRRSGGEVELVADLKGFRNTGVYGTWMGLDQTDAPLLLRDIGSDDIYALTLEEK